MPNTNNLPLPPRFQRLYEQLRKLARQNGWTNTLIALHLARQLHEGQQRKTGEPYFCHPLAVAWKLLKIGAVDDVTIAAALLHDVLEDCADQVTARDLHGKYGLTLSVVGLVQALTHRKRECQTIYYARMAAQPKAILVKLADRWHNLHTMNGAYDANGKQKKLRETIDYVLPLVPVCATHYPDAASPAELIRGDLYSIIESHFVTAN